MDSKIQEGRRFLQAVWQSFNGIVTDQQAGKDAPPLEKPVPGGKDLIRLPDPEETKTNGTSIAEAIANRRSRRKLASGPLSLSELSFLLWATQGVKKQLNDHRAFRTVPSAGARHPFETYLYIFSADRLASGLYRYHPFEHALLQVSDDPGLGNQIIEGLFRQRFGAPVIFLWSVIPYRTEWRYAYESHKVIAIDAGHLCQNLYLACEALDCGTCAVGAYDQKILDNALGLDGTEEFVIYCAPVGKR